MSVHDGKPQGEVTFRYNKHLLAVSLTDDGKLNFAKSVGASDRHGTFNFQVCEASDGPTLTLGMAGTYRLPTKHGEVVLTVSFTMVVTVFKKPQPRDPADPDTSPVLIPINVLVPTFEEDFEVDAAVVAEGLLAVALAL